MMPLDYMLMIMRDETVDKYRRDKMAMAAAPYCHARVADASRGKKVQQTELADNAGIGTPWAADLDVDIRAN